MVRHLRSIVAAALYTLSGLQDEYNSGGRVWPSRRLLWADICGLGGSRSGRECHKEWKRCYLVHLIPVE
jgi:hypothetical protein